MQSWFAETRRIGLSEAFVCVARWYGLGSGFVARRRILEEVGYYDEDAGASADNDLFLRLASRYPLYYANHPHTAWRLHSDNLIHRWSRVEQTREGLRTLGKVIMDKALPDELRRCERDCYTCFYRKILSRALECLQKDDLDTGRQMIDLMHVSGYKGWRLHDIARERSLGARFNREQRWPESGRFHCRNSFEMVIPRPRSASTADAQRARRES